MSHENNIDKHVLMSKLTKARTVLLLRAPFYGTLLMHLKFSLASCGTACTDMKRILWDPVFLDRLSDEETEFVMLHEIMHCVLNHCRRGLDKNHYLYNIAADIVVNSCILKSLGLKNYTVDGEDVICKAPDGKDGDLYNTDQIYEMLLAEYEHFTEDSDRLQIELHKEYGDAVDSHEIWDSIPHICELTEEWEMKVKEAAKMVSDGTELPPLIRELLDREDYNPIIDWRMALHQFVQTAVVNYDFSFSPPDRRYSDAEFILPAFYEQEGGIVEGIWIVIDASGSITDNMLTSVVREVTSCVDKFDSIKACVSFFDTTVTVPVIFESEEDLKDLKPYGGGGTSFHCIFNYLHEEMMDNPPKGIIIFTDGYAMFPDENAAMGIPVVWILESQEEDAPWGKCIHVELEE